MARTPVAWLRIPAYTMTSSSARASALKKGMDKNVCPLTGSPVQPPPSKQARLDELPLVAEFPRGVLNMEGQSVSVGVASGGSTGESGERGVGERVEEEGFEATQVIEEFMKEARVQNRRRNRGEGREGRWTKDVRQSVCDHRHV